MRSRSLACLGFATALALLLPASAAAVESDELRALREENAAMRAQLREQEKRLARLEEATARDSEAVAVGSAGPADPPFQIRLGGFIKSDFLWNNNQVNSTASPPGSS